MTTAILNTFQEIHLLILIVIIKTDKFVHHTLVFYAVFCCVLLSYVAFSFRRVNTPYCFSFITLKGYLWFSIHFFLSCQNTPGNINHWQLPTCLVIDIYEIILVLIIFCEQTKSLKDSSRHCSKLNQFSLTATEKNIKGVVNLDKNIKGVVNLDTDLLRYWGSFYHRLLNWHHLYLEIELKLSWVYSCVTDCQLLVRCS